MSDDVDHELAVPEPVLGLERERHVDQVRHAIGRGAVEALVPLGQLRVEPRGLADQVALVVVGRGGRRAARGDDDDPGSVAAELGRQAEAVLGAIHQHAIGQFDVDSHLDAEVLPGGLGFALARLERAARRGLAARQVEDADAVALLDQLGERPAAEDFEVVRVRRHGRHVEPVGRG